MRREVPVEILPKVRLVPRASGARTEMELPAATKLASSSQAYVGEHPFCATIFLVDK